MSDRIELDKWIALNKVRGSSQACSWCQERMKEGEYGLTIRQDNTVIENNVVSPASQYNIWLHLDCIKDFLQAIEDGVEEHISDVVAKSL